MSAPVKKVCLVSISLAGGGAERSTALLSKLLDNKGYDVHLVILTDAVTYDYAGTLFNLGKYKSKKDTLWKRIQRFAKLKAYFKVQQFDYIIDNRNRSQGFKELYYLYHIYVGQRVVYVARSYLLDAYFPKAPWIARRMITNAAGVVGVSQEIARAINEKYQSQKAIAIYNPISTVEALQIVKEEPPFILFVGRLVDEVKNVSLLLHAFAKADTQPSNVQLKIYGDGPDKGMLVQLAQDLNIGERVSFMPFTTAIFPVMAQAKFLVLTSHYEGFPRALIEALTAGTPVISVRCKSGPEEIIKHENNGLLVNNYDPDALATAMNRFIFDNQLYRSCKENAQASIAHLKEEAIAQQWDDYLNRL